jgi:hypothetical protein
VPDADGTLGSDTGGAVSSAIGEPGCVGGSVDATEVVSWCADAAVAGFPRGPESGPSGLGVAVADGPWSAGARVGRASPERSANARKSPLGADRPGAGAAAPASGGCTVASSAATSGPVIGAVGGRSKDPRRPATDCSRPAWTEGSCDCGSGGVAVGSTIDCGNPVCAAFSTAAAGKPSMGAGDGLLSDAAAAASGTSPVGAAIAVASVDFGVCDCARRWRLAESVAEAFRGDCPRAAGCDATAAASPDFTASTCASAADPSDREAAEWAVSPCGIFALSPAGFGCAS